MSKVRLRLIISLSFALLAAILFGVLLSVPFGGTVRAADATYAPTTIFAQGTGGDVLAPEAAEGETSYVTFSFSNEGSVYYRRNLALKWYEAQARDDSELTDEEKEERKNDYVPGQAAYFSMQFAFDGINFARYEILFESAEENISKAAKSTNSIVFAPGGEGVLKVGIKNAAAHAAEEDEENEDDEFAGVEFVEETIAAADVTSAITISLNETECEAGEFAVTLTVGERSIVLGKFTNIGGNFLEYRSSASSTPSTPITFTAKLAALPEGSTGERPKQQVKMMALNGQALALGSDSRVKDDTPAVLVINEKVYAFTLGQRYSLTTEAIDVCDDTVNVDRYYYRYTEDEAEEEGGAPTPHIPGDNDYKDLTTSTYFLPAAGSSAADEQSISVRFRLRDGRLDKEADYEFVYLAWYAANDEVLDAHTNETSGRSITCIKVVTEKNGPYYIGLKDGADAEGAPEKAAREEAAQKYQDEVTEIANNGKTSAGNGAYIYLPSLRGLIMSDDADYRNFRFNIYYKKENSSSSASSETSLRYNNLRFQIDTEGRYSFKILANDASGNTMKMIVDDELVDVTSSNIWDIEEIPTFTFEVAYNGADIEKPGEQDPASRGTRYDISEFEIVDLGDSIKEYELYYFDTQSDKFPQGATVPTYTDFVENIDEYAETFKDCFVEIERFNDEIDEEDEEAWNNSDNDYLWDPDSDLSFVPQESGFYIVKLLHYDMHKTTDEGKPVETVRYQVIEVRNPYDYIPTKSDWLSNNVTSVVLFSISALLAVIIVILFIVKPSDKKVEEVDLEKLKGKKKNKK